MEKSKENNFHCKNNMLTKNNFTRFNQKHSVETFSFGA